MKKGTRQRMHLLWCCLSVSFACLADGRPPSLMLANVYEPGMEIELADYRVSEKLDGVRGYWDGDRLLTRGGNVVRTPAWFTAGWPRVPLDGELWAGRGRFVFASSTVRSQTPDDEAWRQMRFMVFDLPVHDGSFTERLAALNALLDASAIPWLRAVSQFQLADSEALDAMLEEVVAEDGEGLILHRGSSLYRAGHSDDLLKYKLYQDAIARVVAHFSGKGKYEDMLGALLVERRDGMRFRIGSGFTDAQRQDPPSVGTCVTYAYNGFTVSGIPRFPRFVRTSRCPVLR